MLPKVHPCKFTGASISENPGGQRMKGKVDQSNELAVFLESLSKVENTAVSLRKLGHRD